MKSNKNLLIAALIMVLATAFYRVFPNRPGGFAPQLAVAIFAGSLFTNRKSWAFLLPLISMLVSDGLYHVLFMSGLTDIPGFYKGQWMNYILILATACFGFGATLNRPLRILGATIAGPTMFFLTSNFAVWFGNGGLKREKTITGLMQSYVDGLPFYRNSLIATILFAAIFFGVYAWLSKGKLVEAKA